MKIVVQEVKSAKVLDGESLLAEIKDGIVIYIGVEIDEPEESINWLSSQIHDLIHEKTEDARPIIPYQVLLLSQFTLMAKFKSGKPSFHRAEKTEKAEKYFYNAVMKIKNTFLGSVEAGVFGRNLEIAMELEKPNIQYFSS